MPGEKWRTRGCKIDSVSELWVAIVMLDLIWTACGTKTISIVTTASWEFLLRIMPCSASLLSCS